MKKYCYALFALLAFSFAFNPSSAQQKYSALFIGNSYTYVNNLPQMVEQLALANGDTLITDASYPGGHTLELHTTNSTTLSKISAQSWDFVIMQEQSQKPSFPPSQVAQEVYPFAATLTQAIKANDSCTEPVFYMTWGRKYGDQTNCQFYPPLCTYQGMQQRLRQSYLQMGKDNKATVAPVGIAWKNSIAADSNLNLYSSDNSHPSLAGTYLAACTFYATLFQKSPVGNSYTGGLSANTAAFLQGIASSTVLDSMDTWYINANLPKAAFTAQTNFDTVQFTDNSANAISWMWDFGDGNTSTTAQPMHIYGASGTYVVTLIISSGCAADTLMDTLTVTSNMTAIVPPGSSGDFLVWPNPVEGQNEVRVSWKMTYSGPDDVILYDLRRRIVFRKRLSHQPLEGSLSLTLPDLEPGLYFLLLHGKKFTRTHKLRIGN